MAREAEGRLLLGRMGRSCLARPSVGGEAVARADVSSYVPGTMGTGTWDENEERHL